MRLFFALLCSTFMFSAVAQQSTLSGIVMDEATSEALIGATISVDGKAGAVTDFDGRYELKIPNGDHVLTVSYVSYTNKEFNIDISNDQTMDIKLKSSIILEEVVVSADIAIERETPVAFTNIPTRKIQEELAAQDIPMLLNSTPGVYATETNGGDGDARITIRGFNQRNVAVMLDGIPVNDMENGWVYWSNWFGLDLVTQTMQVQRGLGASKLSVPSVGGTINIITKGIDAKRKFSFKQEIGNNGFFRSTLGITTGRMDGGWGISVAGSYKQGNGWVDANFTKGAFYYLRVDKQFGDHLVSLTGFGAPQEHGQRTFSAPIAQVDTSFAIKNGVPREEIREMVEKDLPYDKGRRYSEDWGMLNGEIFNIRKNYFFKPQFNLRYSWQINSRLFWSNIAYLSIGNGGGTSDDGGDFSFTENGQKNIALGIERNQPTFSNPNGFSNTIIRASLNGHFWYGLLSTFQFALSDNFNISGGFDGRNYKGNHSREVYDLLGGAGFQTEDGLKQVGETYDWDWTGFVREVGSFALIEYKKDKWSTFINGSLALRSYNFEDHMKNFKLGWGSKLSKTIKVGANYNITRQHNVFLNLGHLDRAPRFSNYVITNVFIDDTNAYFSDNVKNDVAQAIELGYGFKSPIFSANINGYYTVWKNKPLDRLPTVPLVENEPESDRIAINVPGIDALHKGIEIDFAFKPIHQLSIEGIVSVGDWIWNSSQIAQIALPDRIYEYEFDAKGVHIGDAAQYQFGGLVRYSPFKDFYVKLKGTHFAKNFSAFNPEDLQGEFGGRESWQMPDYTIFSFHAGYSFKVSDLRFNIRANILNLFDTIYISDANNNDGFNPDPSSDFDAKSASVYFGQGRRGTVSFQISF